MTLLTTLTGSERAADYADLDRLIVKAHKAAMRDGIDYKVGATYEGWKITRLPFPQRHIVVKPSGEVYEQR